MEDIVPQKGTVALQNVTTTQMGRRVFIWEVVIDQIVRHRSNADGIFEYHESFVLVLPFMGYVGADRTRLTLQGGTISPPCWNGHASRVVQLQSGIARRQWSRSRI